ncbi:2-succinyl-5-enolpyruvyl-6-hydroxy-3-cyclohexene-1-carboxylic-acid synthase [Acidiferrimicrobium sp. IK]|uniref:2-succinyl-5-enolpyruvyl-6-hydroxy-3- cyclohexene-1-carboxylic-acid synthase n=1 Tax=Acidiferrimicrobium sp. IK TaxID=2871700 RepID=UPI0021CB8B78|nr:2-succinyl-5-enolpyruvyl-6-hydroxy-3-cyclohexene-1-carboxylic-acid synthase [Acidiferrimicrobium sp. IK]MCU4183644.1 2-succinyl-5-enolpyruvyl-6-hydroxy-3-cyclohexene-1-carboxylic-acid synthase [Acidiferrimicrobium sp. IK]
MTDADVQASFAAVLVDEWVAAGVTDAVVAPGSRSTPMLVALAADSRVRVHVVLDERSAGFVALGLGAATGRPAPVVTTSGTAAVELHPAVVEADLAGVPLLAVTADRPPELHHVGAPQTVEQVGGYGAAPRLTLEPGVPVAATAHTWRALAVRAVAVATDGPLGPGPVHLNLAFREPLLGQPDPALAPPRDGRDRWTVGSRPVPSAVDAAVLGSLVMRRAEGGIIVAGAGAGDPQLVLDVASALGWPVLADPRSGVRVPHQRVVAAADALLRGGPVAGWEPTAVLRLGRPWASKVLAQWLARPRPELVDVLVDPTGRWSDPDQRVTHVIAADPVGVCRALLARAGDGGHVASRWAARWGRAEAAAQKAIDGALPGPALSEPGIARRVLRAVPEGSVVVASSSMPIRDLEWFGRPRAGVRVHSNRGANGIDGVVSTAIGVALSGAPTVGLLGDLAFVYDAGALLWAARRPVECTLIVVDNQGGGIFSFLPQAAALAPERFEAYWGTPHGLDLVALARSYGVDAEEVGDLDALEAAAARPGPGLRVVVARTDRQTNVEIHDRVNAAVIEALNEEFAAK